MPIYCDNCGEATDRLYPQGDSHICLDCKGIRLTPRKFYESLPYIIENRDLME